MRRDARTISNARRSSNGRNASPLVKHMVKHLKKAEMKQKECAEALREYRRHNHQILKTERALHASLRLKKANIRRWKLRILHHLNSEES